MCVVCLFAPMCFAAAYICTYIHTLEKELGRRIVPPLHFPISYAWRNFLDKSRTVHAYSYIRSVCPVPTSSILQTHVPTQRAEKLGLDYLTFHKHLRILLSNRRYFRVQVHASTLADRREICLISWKGRGQCCTGRARTRSSLFLRQATYHLCKVLIVILVVSTRQQEMLGWLR